MTGLTRNPWNLERTPGGVEREESAAIAAGLSPIGIGSDLAISVRGPAAARPVSVVQGDPRPHPLHRTLRAIDGSEPLLAHRADGPSTSATSPWASILQGPDGLDGYAIHAKSTGPANPRPERQIIPVFSGAAVEPGFGPVDREVAAAPAAAAELLRDRGCEVEEVRIPALEQNNLRRYGLLHFMRANWGRYIRGVVGDRRDELHFIGKSYFDVPDPPFAYIDAEIKVDGLEAAMAAYFNGMMSCFARSFPLPPRFRDFRNTSSTGKECPRLT